jgi:hypothetical protein
MEVKYAKKKPMGYRAFDWGTGETGGGGSQIYVIV